MCLTILIHQLQQLCDRHGDVDVKVFNDDTGDEDEIDSVKMSGSDCNIVITGV
jgi:hypothetical protein